ncbi:hypothetical protein SAMN05421847_0344 [Halpernia humi]|uniref:Uncharacterized protein n=1 Tax=Halpernia humi TaxID=493375 RepID=A0A1H5T4Q2_9FLAO|nr:hypothetical protein [Halpernia humi]SEF56997.1 hypothetical protein SAMN05421847_0344 [Halpernia humi]
MAKTQNDNISAKEVWEKHPISFYLGSMVTVAGIVSLIFIFYFNNRIEDIKLTYEKQVENLKSNQATEIEVVKMKVRQEVQQGQVQEISNNSNEGKAFQEFLNNYKNKK